MMRRSRISVRPNVKPTGRAAATSRETPQASKSPADLGNDAEVKAGVQEAVTEVVTEVKSASTAPDVETNDNTESQSCDITSQSDLSVTAADVAGQTASSSSTSTRRKRFSVLPNLSKPRTTSSSTPTSSKLLKSPVRPASTPEIPSSSTQTSSDVSQSPDKHGTAQESAPEPLPISTKSLRSPAPKLPSLSVHSTSRASRFLTKAVTTTEHTPVKASSTPESSPKLPPAPLIPSDGKSKRRKPVTPTQDNVDTLLTRLADCNLPLSNQDAAGSSFPMEEAHSESASISESQNDPNVQDESDLKTPGKNLKPQQHVPVALRTLNDPVDRLRLARARKLRELLKKEMNKEKKKEKHQRPQTGNTEHKKKTKDHTKMTMRELIYYLPSTNPMKSYNEDEQRSEIDPPASPKAVPAVQSTAKENVVEEEEEQVIEEEEPMLAPRVKVAEDGSLIIDEESLTVEVQRMKGPNPVEERDPIFERGSTTTYSSFRKGTYTKPWSNRETDMFFLAISMVGTDFSMIGQLFPHRARLEIKNKFKKEERANSWRIDKAFREKRRLDLDFFNKLLAEILKDEEEKRKKKKHASQIAKIPRRRPGERKRRIYSSDSEGEESSSSETMEGEKENEIVCNDGGSTTAPKKRRVGAPQKSSKHADQSAEQEVEEEAERSANEESSSVHELDLVKKKTESFGMTPVQRCRNRSPVVQRKAQDTHGSSMDENAKESASNDSEYEEEPDLITIQEHILNKPTRSGRIPKLSQHMIRAAADEEDDEEEVRPPAAPLLPNAQPRGSRAKRGRWHAPCRGKSKLLTLRASAPEEEEDDDEEYGIKEDEICFVNVEEENQAFVPVGLRSATTVQAELEETMEELDISVNVPDVLGISQNAVCPESSCERALTPMGIVPCEHQLDLLVDVIEFLAPDNMEVSEEAARTLLTIGHSTHLTQTGDSSSTGDIIIVKESSSHVLEEDLMETVDQSENMVETYDVVTSETNSVDNVSTEHKDLFTTPLQDSTSATETDSSQESKVTCNEMQPEASNLIAPEPTASKSQRKHLPKPNLIRASRTTLRKPAEAVSSSAEMISSPVKADTEPKTVEPIISTVKDFSPKKPSQAEPDEQNLETCDKRDTDQTEVCSSALVFEKTIDDGVSGRTDVEDEGKKETQETHSESKSHSLGSVKPSQMTRRYLGPKPKPNLSRSVRTTHTVISIQQNHPAVLGEKQAAPCTFTDIQQPEEGANMIPEPERVTQNDHVEVIPDANLEEHLHSVCEPSTSDEPVFILSLTEVLPTLREEAEHVTDPLPLPSTSELLSETIRENEAGREKEEESLSPLQKKEQTTQNITAPEKADEPPIEPAAPSHKTGGNAEETDLSAKRKPIPEKSRRAKLQIKPNPNQRKPCRDLSSDESRSAPASSHDITLEKTKPQQTSLKVISSLASTEEDSSSTILDENSKTLTEQNPAILQVSSSSQDIVSSIDLPGTDPMEPSASGVGTSSQIVQQFTPLASTGTLTRPGRRPKGFLSFMSNTSAQRPSESTRAVQKPTIITSRTERRRATPNTSAPPPPPGPQSNVNSHIPAETSCVNPSTPKEDEEPMSVSAYFFNDIFTVVDEQDELD